jgi:cytochrome P450
MKYLIFDSFWYGGLKVKSGMSKFGQQALEERRKQNNSDSPDILNLLFNAETDNGQPLLEKDIVSGACAVMVGGADAPSIAVAHFINCITRDMRVHVRQVTQGVGHGCHESIDDAKLWW